MAAVRTRSDVRKWCLVARSPTRKVRAHGDSGFRVQREDREECSLGNRSTRNWESASSGMCATAHTQPPPFSNDPSLVVKKGRAGYNREAYLTFDLSRVKSIRSAKL